jgi:hypothetical protein
VAGVQDSNHTKDVVGSDSPEVIEHLTVFVALFGEGEPRAGHVEKGYFALAIVGSSGDLQARSGVRFIHFFSGIVWHWQFLDTMRSERQWASVPLRPRIQTCIAGTQNISGAA